MQILFNGMWNIKWLSSLSIADIKEQFDTCFFSKNYWKLYLTGLENTLIITFFALLLGVAIGALIAIVRTTYTRQYDEMRMGFGKIILAILNFICKVYLTVIRGTPVVVQILIIYFIVFQSSNAQIPIAALAFGINSGASVAEIFRSGIMSIDIGQNEAGDSVRAATYNPYFPLIFIAVIYLVMVMFFTWLLGKLERRLRNAER